MYLKTTAKNLLRSGLEIINTSFLPNFFAYVCIISIILAGSITYASAIETVESASLEKAMHSPLVMAKTPSKSEIVDYLENHPTGVMSHNFLGNSISNWEASFAENPNLYGEKGAYKEGRLTDEDEVYALNTVKTIRYMSGVSDKIYLSDIMSNFAQTSCLISYLNGEISHNPKMPENLSREIYNRGFTGSVLSNLAYTKWQNSSLKWSIINGWMYDGDKANSKVLGHRRWILNPSLGSTGFGMISGVNGTYSAMYVNDYSNRDDNTGIIPWPTRYTPTSYFPADSPWSLMVNRKISKEDVIIAITRVSDRKTWSFSNNSTNSYVPNSTNSSGGDFYVDNGNYGKGSCIIFRPNGIGAIGTNPKEDRFFIIVLIDGQKLNYEVNFFNPNSIKAPPAPNKPNLEYFNPDRVSVKWDKINQANSYDIYRKVYKGSWKLLNNDLDENYFNDYSVKKGLKYYYKLVAKNSVKHATYESDFSKSVSIKVPLDEPEITNIKAIKGSVKLNWNKIPKAEKYIVYRALKPKLQTRSISASVKWKAIATVNTTYFTDKSKEINQYLASSLKRKSSNYVYRIRAYRTYKKLKGYSPYSEETYIK